MDYTDFITRSVIEHYLETALWSSTDDNDMPLDKLYGVKDFHEDSVSQAKKQLILFFNAAHENLFAGETGSLKDIDSLERLANRFWLTRNRHGTGFFDSDYFKPIRKILTDLAHAYGECSVYLGDDEKLHFT